MTKHAFPQLKPSLTGQAAQHRLSADFARGRMGTRKHTERTGHSVSISHMGTSDDGMIMLNGTYPTHSWSNYILYN